LADLGFPSIGFPALVLATTLTTNPTFVCSYHSSTVLVLHSVSRWPSGARFNICDDPADGTCKRILEDHMVWSSSQPLSPLLSASSSRAATERSAGERIRRGNERVRIAIIDVGRAVQHAELYWMPYLLRLFDVDVDPRYVYRTEWVFVHEIPPEAITLNTLQGFRKGGMVVLPFPKISG
jgi:hypothetical protein